jgi:hypothetical protein
VGGEVDHSLGVDAPSPDESIASPIGGLAAAALRGSARGLPWSPG